MVAIVSKSRGARLGFLGLLALIVALVAGYFNNCLGGLGLAPGSGSPAAPKVDGPTQTGEVGARVVVQGDQCRRDGEAALRACDAVCAEVGAEVEVEATAGTQRAVDALRTCLQAKGARVKVVSE